MLLLKACPRCHGDLTMDSDARCSYLYCLQCGHVLSREQERALGVRPSRRGLAHLAGNRAHVGTAHPRQPVASQPSR